MIIDELLYGGFLRYWEGNHLDDSKELIREVCAAAEDKKAEDIKVLDITGISPIADYFVICSGENSIQVRAIADEIEYKLSEKGYPLCHREGFESSSWILLDFGNVIVHVFRRQEREFYNLERLWADAQMMDYRADL